MAGAGGAGEKEAAGLALRAAAAAAGKDLAKMSRSERKYFARGLKIQARRRKAEVAPPTPPAPRVGRSPPRVAPGRVHFADNPVEAIREYDVGTPVVATPAAGAILAKAAGTGDRAAAPWRAVDAHRGKGREQRWPKKGLPKGAHGKGKPKGDGKKGGKGKGKAKGKGKLKGRGKGRAK